MIERRTTLAHPSGAIVDLPLIVPSFTSKGFDFFKQRDGRKTRIYSRSALVLETLGPYLSESLLISAYDLHHHHYRTPLSFLRNTALVLLDSGAYELTPDFDLTEPRITEVRNLEFTAADYRAVLGQLAHRAPNLPLLVTNFDWGSRGKPFNGQIREARALFREYPRWAKSFIVKPHVTSSTAVDVDELLPHLANLRGFDVIGFTEKELGKNLMDRLRRIVRLRLELTKREILAPIHVWGGLDPVITPLYFLAGADIFDGVSWLRYAYHQGVAVSRECHAVLEGNLTTPRDHAVALTLSQNLTALQSLATGMRAFANSSERRFEVFDHKREILEKAFMKMMGSIRELRELY